MRSFAGLPSFFRVERRPPALLILSHDTCNDARARHTLRSITWLCLVLSRCYNECHCVYTYVYTPPRPRLRTALFHRQFSLRTRRIPRGREDEEARKMRAKRRLAIFLAILHLSKKLGIRSRTFEARTKCRQVDKRTGKTNIAFLRRLPQLSFH